MSFLSSIFGGGKSTTPPAAQPFQNDPLVNQSDSSLFNFGSNVLQGILPSSYQDLITSNSPEFQRFENNSNAQIQGSAMQTAAMQGNARSGAAGAAATSAIASNTANLGYQDLLNTQLNQKAILGAGLDSINQAGTMALSNQGQENSYASNNYNAGLSYSANMAGINQRASSSAGSLIGQGIGSAGGGIGTILGMLGNGSTGSGITSNTGNSSNFDIDALISSGAQLALAA